MSATPEIAAKDADIRFAGAVQYAVSYGNGDKFLSRPPLKPYRDVAFGVNYIYKKPIADGNVPNVSEIRYDDIAVRSRMVSQYLHEFNIIFPADRDTPCHLWQLKHFFYT